VQHEVQAVMGEQGPGPLERAAQDQAGPGEGDQAEQPQQAKRPQRAQHRDRDDQQVDRVAADEQPA
jgi:hypothetical protein